MLTKKLYTWIAVLLIGVGLLTACYLDVQRIAAEKDNKSVEVLLDYDELLALSKANQLPLNVLSAKFKAAGATGVLMRERTLEDFENCGDILLMTGNELGLLKEMAPDIYPEVNPVKNNRYILVKDKNTFESIYQQLSAKKNGVTRMAGGSNGVISLSLAKTEVEKLGVGFSAQDMELIHQGGLDLVPRIRTWPKAEENSLDNLVKTLQKIPGLSLITFNDAAIFGTNNIPYLAAKLKELDKPVGIFEIYSQQGLNSLALLMDKNVVRIHSISENDMPKHTEAKAVDRFSLAVSERNIRAVSVRFFGMEQPGSALEGAVQYIQRIKAALQKEGFSAGQASVPAGLPYSRILVFLVGLGVLGGGLLILSRLFRESRAGLLGLLGLLGWAALLYLSPLLARKSFALLSVIIFPVIGIIALLNEEKRTMKKAVLALLKMSLLSFTGAIIMTGLLADKSFMLKLDGFSGVKIAHIIPLLVIPAYVIFRGAHLPKKLEKLLQNPVLVKHILLGGIVAIALAVYIMRTGNNAPVLVSNWELQLRSLLDQVLGVRPRTKEFLIGYPAMLALLYYGYDFRKVVLLIFGIIGQISLVNTYAHIHTPLLISLTRSFHGLWMGVLAGLALIILTDFLTGWLSRRMSSE